jgi:hypothetical protein
VPRIAARPLLPGRSLQRMRGHWADGLHLPAEQLLGPTPARKDRVRRRRDRSAACVGQDCKKASRSALIVSAWVVGMPCGNPLYVFSVPFCTSRADSGPESA